MLTWKRLGSVGSLVVWWMEDIPGDAMKWSAYTILLLGLKTFAHDPIIFKPSNVSPPDTITWVMISYNIDKSGYFYHRYDSAQAYRDSVWAEVDNIHQLLTYKRWSMNRDSYFGFGAFLDFRGLVAGTKTLRFIAKDSTGKRDTTTKQIYYGGRNTSSTDDTVKITPPSTGLVFQDGYALPMVNGYTLLRIKCSTLKPNCQVDMDIGNLNYRFMGKLDTTVLGPLVGTSVRAHVWDGSGWKNTFYYSVSMRENVVGIKPSFISTLNRPSQPLQWKRNLLGRISFPLISDERKRDR